MKSCLICHNLVDIKPICEGCEQLVGLPKHSCKSCAVELQQDQELCGNCQKHPPNFSKVYAACDYAFPADDWVKGLKFANQLNLSKVMAELLAKKLQTTDLTDKVLVPVPLHKNRLRKRGYNQAYEIAKELAKITQAQIIPALERTKNTQMQAQLKFNQRAGNVRNAFKVTQNVKNKDTLLIDDVMTSGYTINECARVLKQAQAKDVEVAVFARRS